MLLEYCCGFGMQKPKLATYWHKFHPPRLKEEQVHSTSCIRPEKKHQSINNPIECIM